MLNRRESRVHIDEEDGLMRPQPDVDLQALRALRSLGMKNNTFQLIIIWVLHLLWRYLLLGVTSDTSKFYISMFGLS